MNVPLYGTKQAAYCFFKMFARHTKKMTYKQSKADPFLYFSWVDNALAMFVAWVNGVMVLSPPLLAEQIQLDLEMAFTCNAKVNSPNTSAASLISHKAISVWEASSLLNPF